uniref:Uncharacterized protein n=1 Tax=Anguilla anguilla TaxID=7936 RepID=A0A0E9WKA2_ANGAN
MTVLFLITLVSAEKWQRTRRNLGSLHNTDMPETRPEPYVLIRMREVKKNFFNCIDVHI